jgi:hypothetical protein
VKDTDRSIAKNICREVSSVGVEGKLENQKIIFQTVGEFMRERGRLTGSSRERGK